MSSLTRRLYFQESPPVSSTAGEKTKNDDVLRNSGLEIMTDRNKEHLNREMQDASANILSSYIYFKTFCITVNLNANCSILNYCTGPLWLQLQCYIKVASVNNSDSKINSVTKISDDAKVMTNTTTNHAFEYNKQ